MVLLAILMQETTVLLSPANTNTQCGNKNKKMIGSGSENGLGQVYNQGSKYRQQKKVHPKNFYSTFTLIFRTSWQNLFGKDPK